MPADDYTPGDSQVREAYTEADEDGAPYLAFAERAGAFDRWLAAHDARVCAEAAARALRSWADGTEASLADMPADIEPGVIAGMRAAVKSARITAEAISRGDADA